MSKYICFKNFGWDAEDKTTDKDLLNTALYDPDNVYKGYLIDDGWGCFTTILSQDITELRMKQRLQRVFLLVFLFQPQTRREAVNRESALRRFAPETEAACPTLRIEVTVTQTERGPAR